MLAVGTLHLPVVLVVGFANGARPSVIAAAVLWVGVLVIAGQVWGDRRRAAVLLGAATVAGCSAALLVVTDGSPVAGLHPLAGVVLIGLYGDLPATALHLLGCLVPLAVLAATGPGRGEDLVLASIALVITGVGAVLAHTVRSEAENLRLDADRARGRLSADVVSAVLRRSGEHRDLGLVLALLNPPDELVPHGLPLVMLQQVIGDAAGDRSVVPEDELARVRDVAVAGDAAEDLHLLLTELTRDGGGVVSRIALDAGPMQAVAIEVTGVALGSEADLDAVNATLVRPLTPGRVDVERLLTVHVAGRLAARHRIGLRATRGRGGAGIVIGVPSPLVRLPRSAPRAARRAVLPRLAVRALEPDGSWWVADAAERFRARRRDGGAVRATGPEAGSEESGGTAG